MTFNANRPEWTARAACRGVANVVFFPTEGRTYDEARSYCAVCPVQRKCLQWALSIERGCSRAERHGMYGGCTPQERFMNRPRSRRCEVCGDLFTATRITQKLCGDKGCWNAHRAEYMESWRARTPA